MIQRHEEFQSRRIERCSNRLDSIKVVEGSPDSARSSKPKSRAESQDGRPTKAVRHLSSENVVPAF